MGSMAMVVDARLLFYCAVKLALCENVIWYDPHKWPPCDATIRAPMTLLWGYVWGSRMVARMVTTYGSHGRRMVTRMGANYGSHGRRMAARMVLSYGSHGRRIW